MKQSTENYPGEVVGELEYIDATLHVSPHIFKLLSGAYSDLPRAIVREYASNMVDGYARLAGVPVDQLTDEHVSIQPTIHLPNSFERYIEFEDYGSGMSLDHQRSIFTKVGLSDKWDSDNEIGGKGLGAKTASYYEGCDQWTFHCRYNGKKYFWVVTKNAEGIPRYVLASITDTKESNGVTIRIPVIEQDIVKFRDVANEILPYFPITFNVTGSTGMVKIPKLEYTHRGDKWGFSNQNSDSSIAVMGGVPYRINRNFVYATGNAGLNKLLDSKVILFFSVGELDVTPQREALQYTIRTINTIRQRAETAVNEVVDLIVKSASEVTTFWEKWERVNAPNVNMLASVMHAQLEQQLGEDLFGNRRLMMSSIWDKYPDAKIKSFKTRRRSQTVETGELRQGDLVCAYPGELLTYFPAIFYIDDVGSGVITRVKDFVKARHMDGKRVNVLLVKGMTKDELLPFLEGAPESIIRMASELPKPVVKRTPRTAYQKSKVRLWDYPRWVDAGDTPGRKVYIQLFNSEPHLNEDLDFKSQLLHLKVLGFGLDLYGVQKDKKPPQDFVPLSTFVREALVETLPKFPNWRKKIINSNPYKYHHYDGVPWPLLKELKIRDPLIDSYIEAEAILANNQKREGIEYLLAKHLDLFPNLPEEEVIDIQEIRKEIMKKYPLFSMVASSQVAEENYDVLRAALIHTQIGAES